jgi:ABC-2 type transport system ATP-binding protein
MDTDIVFEDVTKRFGPTLAVNGLTATVRAGRVTAFLGPNGAGKTTSLRMLLGLVRPTSGQALVGGRLYAELDRPVRRVGAMLEATGFHPGRRAVDHLRVVSVAAGLDRGMPARALEQVGLGEDGHRKVGEFSLGMRQRLGLATALLGDPPLLVLDEPANGLDPHGIRWLRGFLRGLAAEGRTVLVSSHLLQEVEQTADDVLLLADGRLVRSGTLAELRGSGASASVVRTPEVARLAEVLAAAGYRSTPALGEELLVTAPTEEVGRLAAEHGVVLHGLAEATRGLEDVFMGLTEVRR